MNYYELKRISNSSLSYINSEEGGSPKKYKKFIIDKVKEDKETPSLENGKIIHKYVENPEEFMISDVTKPSDMMSSWVEEVYTALLDKSDINNENSYLKELTLSCRGVRYKSIKDEDVLWKNFCSDGIPYLKYLIDSEGKIALSGTNKEIITNCIYSLKENKKSNDLLFNGGINEMCILWNIDGLELKSLLDKVIIDKENKKAKIVDLKTTSKSGYLFKNSFRYYRYYRQMAFYRDALLYYLKENVENTDWQIDVFIVTVETTGLYETHVYSIPEEWLIEGKEEYLKLLDILKYHYGSDNWDYFEQETNDDYIIELSYESKK